MKSTLSSALLALFCGLLMPTTALAQSDFAKQGVSERAPEVPSTIACPEKSTLQRSESSLWCRDPQGGYGASVGPYYSLKQDRVRVQEVHLKGKADGISRVFYEDGSLQYRRSYDRGELLLEVGYHEGGAGVMFEKTYKGGKIASLVNYAKQGHRRSVETYGDGKLTERVSFYQNGNKASQVVYPGGDTSKAKRKSWDEEGIEQ